MRDALRAAADREARAIVASAQRDIEQVLRKANEDLVALNAHVRALSEAADTSLPAEQAGVKFGRRAGDLQQVAAIVRGAQQELADVSDATRSRLEALSAEAAAGAEASRSDRFREGGPESDVTAPPRQEPAADRRATAPPDRAPQPEDRGTEARSVEVTPARGEQVPGPTARQAVVAPGPPSMMAVDRADATAPATPALPAVDSVDAFDAFPPARAVAPAKVEPVTKPVAWPAEIAPRTGLPSSFRTFVAAFTVLGVVILAATGWWVWQSRARNLAAAVGAATSSRSPVAGSPADGVSPAATSGSSPSAAATGDDTGAAAAPAEPTSTETAATPSELAVKVEAVRPAWLRVTVDDRVIAAREFQPGESQTFKGARDVQIRAGDAGAVRVSVGSAVAVPLGRDGQSITRRFAANEPAAPAASTSPAPGGVPNSVGTNGPSPTVPVPKTEAATGSGLTNADRAAVPAGAVQPPMSATPAPTPSPPPRTTADAVAGIPAPGPGGNATSGESVTHGALETQFVRAVVRWFEAYQRQDRTGMAAFSSGPPSVSDERTESERAPRGAGGVRRTFEDVRLQLVTENAVFTTKMTERFDDPSTGRSRQWDSFVSQLWTLRGGVWQLEDVRVVPTSKLKQNFR